MPFFSDFTCPPNDDVQDFLLKKAIRFEKEGSGNTHLILNDSGFLLTYFTVTFKDIKIHPDTSRSRVRKLKARNNTVSTYLIGQIGKNKSIPDNPINLEHILADVFVVIKQAQALIGGRTIILECENNEKLIRLYESQGFQTVTISQDPEDKSPLVTMFISIN